MSLKTPPPHRTETKKAEVDQAKGRGFGHSRYQQFDTLKSTPVITCVPLLTEPCVEAHV